MNAHTLLSYIDDGGPPIMWTLVALFVIGLAITVWRLIIIFIAMIHTKSLFRKVYDALDDRDGGLKKASDICSRTPGPVATIIHAGLSRIHKGIDHVEKGGVHGGYALRDWQDGELSQDTVDLPDCIILQESPLKIWSRHKTGLPALLHDRYRLIKSFLSTDGKQERNWYDQLDAFYLPFIGFDGVVRPGPNLYVYLRKDVVFDSP